MLTLQYLKQYVDATFICDTWHKTLNSAAAEYKGAKNKHQRYKDNNK